MTELTDFRGTANRINKIQGRPSKKQQEEAQPQQQKRGQEEDKKLNDRISRIQDGQDEDTAKRKEEDKA